MEVYSATSNREHEKRLIKNINETPNKTIEYISKITEDFRKRIALTPEEISFKKGWEEAMSGKTMPIDKLWVGIKNDG
ncbi:MAG: hypothetical protein JRJ49_01310 [Deltaproteobacteria bacterium]|nr:hypothetical protein [Deltaproteobacteria bacterium]